MHMIDTKLCEESGGQSLTAELEIVEFSDRCTIVNDVSVAHTSSCRYTYSN